MALGLQQKRCSLYVAERRWAKWAPLLVVRRTSKRPLQAVFNGIFYVLKNGCVWRDVPADFPPWPTVYCYFTQCSANGTRQLYSPQRRLSSRNMMFK